MTEKVIIDGIDVSKCKYYRKEHPDDDCAISRHCEAYGDCDYKNLQLRKQFRNLQVQYEKVVEQNRQLQQELREQTAECEELKIKLMQMNGWKKVNNE